MADEQVSFTSLVLIVVLGGLVIRYLFFPSSAAGSSGAHQGRDAAASSRAREAAVERIQQVFPQLDRRSILWELQRNRGNIATTTERILTGRAETPPVTFQPLPPPTSTTPSSTSQPAKTPLRPAEPDLITRYKLQGKLDKSSGGSTSDAGSEPTAPGSKTKAWSSNREERQVSLQRRRDEMILAARRKMEVRIASEKAAASGSGGGST
ncbi:hypothetical protein E0Z10_g5772 [Xylaria hypoxylon]|uniref:Coupling of ubiquitin conjugation to ER degradation protein 1 n=1 Tax=Xylaria hypoxylon TaxID=37992 RepID=A0A4Z0YSI5_9PEZI|nr:hypothetical protein E0Z10_g5772 [Xylaria hypoxylon]